jgi:hypothetical protein
MQPDEIDRRIGRRVRVRRVPATIEYTTRGAVRTRTRRLACVLVDLSVTGARLEGPASRHLTPGCAVTVDLGHGARATATVRRVPTGSTGAYGLEIVQPNAAFAQLLAACATKGRGNVDLAWRRAR